MNARESENYLTITRKFSVAPVSYYCLIFFIGLRPKLGIILSTFLLLIYVFIRHNPSTVTLNLNNNLIFGS
jgi:uncharacterized integral membrane protein